jgi:hypothetical protein
MKQQISPAVFVSILAVVLLVVGVFAWRTWVAPSSVPVSTAEQKGINSPRAGGGGPTAEDLKRRDEYNRTHPGAAGSR